MGYNVAIVKSTAKIAGANLAEAYQRMCALNTTHYAEKRGGSWASGAEEQKWFSWMDANYPETCSNALAVLEQLGFDVIYEADGSLVIDGYDSKTGQEELFFQTIADLVTGTIDWEGEDGLQWRWNFDKKKMAIK